MIITLDEAEKIYPNVTQADLDGLEISIRELTNNPFQNRRVRFCNLRFEGEATVIVFDEVEGLRNGDTIQISASKWNNGLYVIKEVAGNTIILDGNPKLFTGNDKEAYLTKVEYPADILAGVRKLLKYDTQMTDKMGLKSKTVSRVSETYFDQNSGETINGYPAAMMSFVDKYRLLKW
ncbi:hypothetical protein [Enterococcus diestrammenae]|uniref:hypothetical protein n=1 Tax=Enterococcus diestrammenae TaxID=1155073 RepID=UPI00195AF85D